MNLDEFIKEIKPNFGWSVITAVPPLSLPGNIRDRAGFCPLCHVAYHKGLGFFSNSDAHSAGRRLGIDCVATRQLIMDAADGRGLNGTSYWSDEKRTVRKHLLKATGLKEQA